MNYKLVRLTRILLSTMAISTILLILVCISDNKIIIQKFMSVYGISFFLLFFIYIPIVTLLQLKSLSKKDSKDRLVRFAKCFICYFLISGCLSIVFKSKDHTMFRIISMSLGASFGISFFDLLILKKTSELN